MTLVKMKLPVFGSAESEYVPCFKLRRADDETDEQFVKAVEKAATLLLGDITDKEYLSRRAIGGTMPRLNRVFEEMKVHYGERKVREKVLRSVEAKAAKAAGTAAAVQATAQAESRKRKGAEPSKAPRKKVKSGRGSKVAASEEAAESAHGDTGGTQRSAEANQSEASVVRPDVDLMDGWYHSCGACYFSASARGCSTDACVLSGDSSGSSAAEANAASSTSASEEMPTEVDGCSAKTPRADELEAESEERSRGKTVVEPPLVFAATSDEALEG